MMSRYKPVGWRSESYRHYLAARGIKTKFKYGDVPDSLFIRSQLKEGAKVETEHTDDPVLAKQIAKAHLVERPRYYEELSVLESQKPGKLASVRGVPIEAEKLVEGRIYPISVDEVKAVLERMPKEDLKGLVAVEFVNPKGPQTDAWGQYIRSTRTLKIFSQPFRSGKVDSKDSEVVRKHIRDYVLPHEIGHHQALYKKRITDKNIEMAEARADANVVGMDVDDKDVKVLKNMRSYAALR